jgi:hypothetical protein
MNARLESNLQKVCITHCGGLGFSGHTEWTIVDEIGVRNDSLPGQAPSGNVHFGTAYAHPASCTEDEVLPKIVAKGAPLQGVSIAIR